MTTTSDRRKQTVASLQDKEYRDLFVSEEINTGLPFQIRAMRQARGWSQEELAERLGMTQEGISRLESLNYGKFTLSTLKRLASAFDVALIVRFAPFSQLVDWVANLSAEDLAVPDYASDLELVSDPTRAETTDTAAALPLMSKDVSTQSKILSLPKRYTPKVSARKACTTQDTWALISTRHGTNSINTLEIMSYVGREQERA